MKKLISAMILGGLLSTGLFALSFEKTARPASTVAIGEANHPASPVSIREVLRAHNLPQNLDALSAFSAEAVRLTSRPPGIDRDLSSFFERHISVAMVGNTYRRHTADPLRLREQFDLFDGSLPYNAVAEKGRLVEESNQVMDSQARGVEFGIKTFSLVPILRQLSDPSTEVVYSGRTAYGQDKFDVKTATDRWTLYTNVEHLICRMEVLGKTIEFANYRSVDGIRLPFIQRLSIDGQLFQELIFTRIELNPKLSPAYFSREALLKELVR